ncbi:6119_t:CDS:2 [Funneliformis caledonium]|uniref:6119_t:CDS:1 n=2 Tax=Funneliformis TaxID=1117308 RepID=A0A9N9FXC2_9GLOM|nr:16012_t:CDS:2 [Funneliformis mosseae]CAG8562658.1 6119_t:CDS:2 [Funneliformis caledonium]
MSKDTEFKNLNYWLEKSIVEKHIKYYEYLDFNHIKLIGEGSYGNVNLVKWRSTRLFALKSFNNNKQSLKEVIKELRLHRSVDDHENIIRLFGITKNGK